MGKLCILVKIVYIFNIINGGLKMSTTTQAGQRIQSLLDENSFVKFGALGYCKSNRFQLETNRNSF